MSANVFWRIDIVAAWGRGMALTHENAPTVAFREVGQLFIASFVRPSFSLNDAETADKAVERQENTKETPQKHPKTTAKATGTTTSTTTGGVSGKAALLLEHLRAHSQTTIPDLARLLGMTEDGVNYHLRRLQAAGLLRREGSRSVGHWVVAQAPNQEAMP